MHINSWSKDEEEISARHFFWSRLIIVKCENRILFFKIGRSKFTKVGAVLSNSILEFGIFR